MSLFIVNIFYFSYESFDSYYGNKLLVFFDIGYVKVVLFRDGVRVDRGFVVVFLEERVVGFFFFYRLGIFEVMFLYRFLVKVEIDWYIRNRILIN